MCYNGIVKKVGAGHHWRNPMVAFLMPKMRWTLCPNDRKGLVLFPAAPHLRTDGSAKSTRNYRNSITISISGIQRPGNVTAGHGSISAIATSKPTRYVSYAKRMASWPQPRKFITSLPYPKAATMMKKTWWRCAAAVTLPSRLEKVADGNERLQNTKPITTSIKDSLNVDNFGLFIDGKKAT